MASMNTRAKEVIAELDQFEVDMHLVNTWVHGADNLTVLLGGVSTPTIKNLVKNFRMSAQEILDAADYIQDNYEGLEDIIDANREYAEIAETLLLKIADWMARDLATMNQMNIDRYNDWYARGIENISDANILSLQAAENISDITAAFDDSTSKHRLQVRLFDGSNPSASSKPVLFVISGQSNAVGCGLYPPCTQAKDSGSFWSWANGDNELKPIVDPISNENKGSGWPEFASLFFELTGRKTILLNIANGGSTVTDGGYTTANTWADNGYGTLRTSRSGVWNAFSSAVPATDYDLGGILWVQGEYDAQRLYAGTITVGEYSGTWDNLSEGTRGVLQWTRNLIGVSNCPIFIGLIGYQQSCKTNTALKNAYDAIINAQRALVDYTDIFPGFSMTPQFFDAWGKYYSDGIHYNRKGYRLQGRAFARSVVNYLHL